MKKNIFLSIITINLLGLVFFAQQVQAAACGEIFNAPATLDFDINGICQCSDTMNAAASMGLTNNDTEVQYCCGFLKDGACRPKSPDEYYLCGETKGTPTVPDGVTCNCEGASWQPYFQVGIFNRGICCGWPQDDHGWGWDTCHATNPALTTAHCGDTYPTAQAGEMTCVCSGGGANPLSVGSDTTCCGFVRDGVCNSSESGLNDISVTDDVLNELNPILIAGGTKDLSTPGGIISRALTGFVFPIAGLILFVMLLLGGFQMLTGAANSKSIDEGKQKITSAIVGFIILFAAYWIAQLLELIFGIRILS